MPPPIALKLDYLKSIHGILKIIEIILLLLGFACAAGFNSGYYDKGGLYGFSVASSRVAYFIAVSIIVWLMCIAFFVLCLLGFYDKIEYARKKLIVGIVHGAVTLFLLIGAGVAAAHAGALPCFHFNAVANVTCTTLDFAVVFGFLAVVALVVDTVLFLFVGYKENIAASGAKGSPDSPRKDFEE